MNERTMYRFAIAVLLAAIFATAAAAATTPSPTYWSKAQAQQLLLKGPGGANRWSLNPTVMTPSMIGAGYFRVKTAVCAGVGKPRKGPVYSGFNCNLTWTNSSDISHTMNKLHVWARVARDSKGVPAICVSDKSLAACPLQTAK